MHTQDEEIDGVLLEFAGFTPCQEGMSYTCVVSPEGEHSCPPPDLQRDLNAQKKWIWPKLGSFSLVYTPGSDKPYGFCTHLPHYEAEAPDPAEACVEVTLQIWSNRGDK